MTQIEGLREQVRAALDRARALECDPNWSRLLEAGVWSAAQCVAHLSQSSDMMLPPLEEAVHSAGTGPGPYRLNWKERLLIWYMEPPYRLKVKTRGGFTPQPAEPEHILMDFEQRQHRLEELLNVAEGKALDLVRITSPFSANVSYSAWAGLMLLQAHQRRHLWQAGQILSRLRI